MSGGNFVKKKLKFFNIHITCRAILPRSAAEL